MKGKHWIILGLVSILVVVGIALYKPSSTIEAKINEIEALGYSVSSASWIEWRSKDLVFTEREGWSDFLTVLSWEQTKGDRVYFDKHEKVIWVYGFPDWVYYVYV